MIQSIPAILRQPLSLILYISDDIIRVNRQQSLQMYMRHAYISLHGLIPEKHRLQPVNEFEMYSLYLNLPFAAFNTNDVMFLPSSF